MGGSSAFSISLSNYFRFNVCNSFSNVGHPHVLKFHSRHMKISRHQVKKGIFVSLHNSKVSPTFAVAEILETPTDSSEFPKDIPPKIDKSGRFCSPRAARELALLISYAACLEGMDPVRLFDKRVNAKRFPGFVFDKASLLEYNHMSFGGDPISVKTEEEAKELLLINERESANEADVLSAPPKLVYNNFVLRLTRKILEAVVQRWDQHVLIIDKVVPTSWKNEPAGRIIEFCIMHLAMSEIAAVGTRHQIVINEAVDLAKRFCDGTAPRVINGCLRTYVKAETESAASIPVEGES